MACRASGGKRNATAPGPVMGKKKTGRHVLADKNRPLGKVGRRPAFEGAEHPIADIHEVDVARAVAVPDSSKAAI